MKIDLLCVLLGLSFMLDATDHDMTERLLKATLSLDETNKTDQKVWIIFSSFCTRYMLSVLLRSASDEHPQHIYMYVFVEKKEK